MSAERRLSEVFKSFSVPINEKARGRIHTTELLENIIYSFMIYPNLCICKNTLTFYERGVEACELWKERAALHHH